MKLRTRNYLPDELITHWQIPLFWWENHTTSDLVYEVRFHVADSAALNAAWRLLSERYTAHDGELWIGGAALRRVDPEHVDASSGGEDALDSLEWVINDDFFGALREVADAAATSMEEARVGARVVHELRIPLVSGV
ncbi:XRE family transcriptional regulator [Schaalia sp. Marseille-Q2122]|uniref:XRE family transcriptional regulator n=1 Tax=Schaalia sp. Marseille-Q2122 TaxID=2736604 RepID=UPI0015891CFC|nr:XRE family transcriptional regulator [Schaalia sp. Marseille-Q2122]